MGAPKNLRLPADFDQWFPEGLYLVGQIVAVLSTSRRKTGRATVLYGPGWTR